MTNATADPDGLDRSDFAHTGQRVPRPDGLEQRPHPATLAGEDASADSPPRVAVLVCHGMGQQLPFETLDRAAEAIRRAEHHRPGSRLDSKPRVGTLKVEPPAAGAGAQRQSGQREAPEDPTTLSRIELAVTGNDGRKRDIHLYEVYWAPLTEGKLRDRDVVGFLLRAGRNGLVRAPRHFKRFLFDEVRSFSPARWTLAAFLITFLTFIALWTIQGVIVAVAGARALFGATLAPAGGRLSDAVLEDLTIDLGAVVGAALVILACTELPAIARARVKDGDYLRPWRFPLPLRWLCRIAIFLALVVICASAAAMLLHLTVHSSGTAAWWRQHGVSLDWLRDANGRLPGEWQEGLLNAELAVVWVAALAVSWQARWFLRQFLGDVVAYVDPYVLDEFWELRQQIKDRALRVGKAVYGAEHERPGRFLYDAVVVVAHSLGAVVAYDMLNGLVFWDGLTGGCRRVAARTDLLLTFGAPLDKTAFVFGTQRVRRPPASTAGEAQDEPLAQDRLVAAIQPLITDYANRPRCWLNLWSWDDPISGTLDFYDPPQPPQGEALPAAGVAPAEPKRIVNVEDPEAATPLRAHNEYWGNLLFVDSLYQAVSGQPIRAAADARPGRPPTSADDPSGVSRRTSRRGTARLRDW